MEVVVNNPLMDSNQVPSLFSLCVHKTVTSLISPTFFKTHYTTRIDEGLDYNEWYEHYYYKILEKRIDLLVIPEVLKKALREAIWPVSREYHEWMNNRSINHALEFQDLKYDAIEFLAWTTNRRIDYRKSVTNLISSSLLDKNQQFRLLCNFCMKEELLQFPLKDLNQKIVLESLYGASLFTYWYLYLNNSLGEFVEYYRIIDSISNWVVFVSGFVWNELAFEHFWNEMNENEKCTCLIKMSGGRINPAWFVNIFPRWTKHKQEEFLLLFSRVSYQWYDDFHNCKYLILRLWNMEINIGSFRKCLKNICRDTLHNVEYRSVVKILWNMLPYDLQLSVMQKKIFFEIGLILHSCKNYLTFLGMVLVFTPKDREALIRSKICMNFMETLIFENNFKCYNVFVNTCLVETDRYKFQIELLSTDSMNKHIIDQFTMGEYKNMKEFFIVIFFQGVNPNEENTEDKNNLDNSHYNQLVKIIGTYLPQKCPESSPVFTKQLWKNLCTGHLNRNEFSDLKKLIKDLIPKGNRSLMKSVIEKFYDMKKIVEIFKYGRYIFYEQRTRLRKNTSNMYDYLHDIHDFHEFLKWLYPTQKQLDNFKKKLDINHIFYSVMREELIFLPTTKKNKLKSQFYRSNAVMNFFFTSDSHIDWYKQIILRSQYMPRLGIEPKTVEGKNKMKIFQKWIRNELYSYGVR